ncbi:hypothetical protein [Dyadobacter bucti]|uniref:hypothetical protein n=1 Tax=Dyadobacter bucti TaxID=2572203 RepID=UPI001109A243|nr:hypothetical protein [Dyadobacter bucti]
MIAELRAAGWVVILRVLKTNREHKDRFGLIDSILAEGGTRLPRVRFNQNTCKALIISMQSSPVIGDMKNDKSSEGSASVQQENSTRLSDCLQKSCGVQFPWIDGRT